MIDTGRFIIVSPWEIYRKEDAMRKKGTKSVKKPAAGKGMAKGGPEKIERGFKPTSKQGKANRAAVSREKRLEGRDV